GSNGGFGAGCNAGFAVALANAGAVRHVLLINPDARATAGMVDRLCAAAAAHPDAGIVGGTILAADGRTVQFANGRHRPWTLSRLHCAAPSREAAFATTFVTGALMLVDAGMLRAGLRFDERFFLYVEDLDLCCEVRDRGRTLWIEPRAIALHRGGACAATAPAVLGTATADQVYWLARSKVLFAGKRANAWQRRWLLLLAAVVKPIAGLLIAPNGRFLTAHWRGLRDGLRTLRAERRGATPPSAATPPAPSRA
ncbi:MAG: glycosyltransferase family 2 protein, partial [Planctomycetes bacterium]|nr:glycosyltransferase family 2 protein [Planctomycetota bacterium]